jgi:hypothetical protein
MSHTVSSLIKELTYILEEDGDLPIVLQNSPVTGDLIMNEAVNFAVVEDYPDTGKQVSLRYWPY